MYRSCIAIFTPSSTKKFPSANEKICILRQFPGCKDDLFNFSLKIELCLRDCPIEWLLKVEASETGYELLMAWIVEKAFLNLWGAEGGDLPDEQALSEISTVLSTKVL